jgi:NADH-ubiquinone oxidoreductase subunit 10
VQQKNTLTQEIKNPPVFHSIITQGHRYHHHQQHKNTIIMTDMYDDKVKKFNGGSMKPYPHEEFGVEVRYLYFYLFLFFTHHPSGEYSSHSLCPFQISIQIEYNNCLCQPTQRGRAKDPVAYLHDVEQRARERQVAYETVKLLRQRVIACYRKEGMDHYEHCRDVGQAYYDVIIKKDLGQLHPKWTDPAKNDGW